MDVLLIVGSDYFEFPMIAHIILKLDVHVTFVLEYFGDIISLHGSSKDKFTVLVHGLFINLKG